MNQHLADSHNSIVSPSRSSRKGPDVVGLLQSDYPIQQVKDKLTIGLNLVSMIEPPKRKVVMFHIGWGGEQTIIYKGVVTFP